MSLQKLNIQAEVDREDTPYGSEGVWYECDKVRFRQGRPEKIGGWIQNSANTFIGVCRSLWAWSLLSGVKLRGIGTDVKFYLDDAGTYYDITPLRATTTLASPFATTNGSAIVTVTDGSLGYIDGDYVTFSNASAVGGITIDGEYLLSNNGDGTYTITHTSAATSTTTGGGAVTAEYQINVGTELATDLAGWGAGAWGTGTWGNGTTTEVSLRRWNQSNFGQDLIAGPSGGELYLWSAANGLSSRMSKLSEEVGASDVPSIHNILLISDVSRFVFVFGTNNVCGEDYDPMLVRWSDQEAATSWTPLATNQAGSLRLSRGSKIIAAIQARQEILVWTDIALYSFQFTGAPGIWGAQLVGENISIASASSVSYSNGIAYWMGQDKFYMYSGRTQSLPCSLRRYIFSDINSDQLAQVFSGTNEAFHEIWWFYPSAGSTTVDSYVIYNYAESIWYYGALARTAWLDQAVDGFPVAATYNSKLVQHENGIDDYETGSAVAIDAFIRSSDFDIDDGYRYSFVWRVIPDVSFTGSTAVSPSVTMTLYPLKNSGSGRNNPLSEGGISTDSVTRSATVPVEEYTDQINIRVRGRQMSLEVRSIAVGTQWQLGAPRIDIRADGRRA